MFTYTSKGREVTEPMLEMFSRFELPISAWQELSAESKRIGIDFFSTPLNETDLDLILPLGIPAIKVGSDDLTNTNLIRNFTFFNMRWCILIDHCSMFFCNISST